LLFPSFIKCIIIILLDTTSYSVKYLCCDVPVGILVNRYALLSAIYCIDDARKEKYATWYYKERVHVCPNDVIRFENPLVLSMSTVFTVPGLAVSSQNDDRITLIF
jgi:hypothetical protein